MSREDTSGSELHCTLVCWCVLQGVALRIGVYCVGAIGHCLLLQKKGERDLDWLQGVQLCISQCVGALH